MESPEELSKEQQRKQRQAKYALERYHRLSEEEKKALSKKRSLQQKRKRQQKKELMELESILRASHDIIEIPKDVPSPPSPQSIPETDKELIQKEKNARKALRARVRYHNMTSEERKNHNQKRSASFKKLRDEEQSLLMKPLSEVKSEDLDRIEEIMSRKARTARNARVAYQRMTPDERKAYNQKRKKYYIPKRKPKNSDAMSQESADPDVAMSPELVNIDID